MNNVAFVQNISLDSIREYIIFLQNLFDLSKLLISRLIIIITLNIRTIDRIFIVMINNVSADMSFGFFRCFMSNSGVHIES